MAFMIRPDRRFPVQCFVKYRIGSFTGTGTVWNLSLSGWRLSGDLPMCRGEILSLNVTLPNEQRIKIQEAIVRWSRGEEFGIETVGVSKHTQDRLAHYVRRLTQAPLL
jgi:PilZ domain-containing protein